MKVLHERELVYKLDKILKKKFGTNLAFHEFSAGYGIADLVFAGDFSFNKNSVKRTPLTDFNCLNLFLTLEDENVYSLNDIQTLFIELTLGEIKKQIRTLINSKYIRKIGNQKYQKIVTKNEINPINKIIAVEVKLSDHRGGLTQARRYQYFADESYLAILKEAEKNINFNEFNKYNIGLILFDIKTNSVEIKYPNQTNNNFEKRVSLFAKEMMFSKYISTTSQIAV